MKRSPLWNAIWILAFLTLFALLILYVGPDRVVQSVRQAEPVYLVAAFCSYALFFVARGLRWKNLLRPIAQDANAKSAAALSAGGWLISTFVPFKAGDVARVALMARRHDASLIAVSGTVALERALDVMGLALASSVGLLLAAVLAQTLPATVAKAVALAWILPVVGLFGLFLLARWIPMRSKENIVMRFAHRFLTAARELRANPRRLPKLFALTVLITGSQVGIFAFLFHAFFPTAPWTPVLAGVPLFLLSFVFAVTPGQVGTYEAAFVAVFTLMGFAPDLLLPAAVACHLLTVSFVTLLGTIGFLVLRTPDRQARPAAEAPPSLPMPEREANA